MRAFSVPCCASLLLLSAALAGTARAQTTEIQTARAAGMGGAFRAMAFDNSAIDLNPAAMAQVQKFDFEGGYYRTVEDPTEYALQVAIADSLTNVVATGFAFEFRRIRIPDPDGGTIDASVQRYVTGVGIPIVPQFLHIGFNGKFIQSKLEGTKDKRLFTSDFTLHARPVRMLALAAGFDNMVNGNEPEAPRTITGGAAFLPVRWFAVSGDVFQDLATDPEEDHIGWAFGAQWLPTASIAFRGGVYEPATDPDTRERVWTAGLGLLAETGSIDYAMRISDGDSETLSHHLTLSVLVF